MIKRVAFLLLLCFPLYGQTQQDDQLHKSMQRLVAGFISTFPSYVVWPPEVFAGHPNTIRMGLIGRDPLGAAGRNYLQGRGFMSQRFALDLLQPGVYTRDQLGSYQMLYISVADPKKLKAILKLVADQPVLTISAVPGFINAGGIVEFTITDRAATFEVSMANGRRAGLQIDPRLAKYGQTM